MKKLVLALTVLAFCSVSFAGTPDQGEADANQQADTAAQESALRQHQSAPSQPPLAPTPSPPAATTPI
jgi:hypothetical protein